ncbi:hypothetical protein DXA95_04505 [Odoribacter sp. OF09-27XD]|nr:hypothetical protein DXA95_04505 [Odoribacter sp. OF09-27XD]
MDKNLLCFCYVLLFFYSNFYGFQHKKFTFSATKKVANHLILTCNLLIFNCFSCCRDDRI